jgi:hypothetical protein
MRCIKLWVGSGVLAHKGKLLSCVPSGNMRCIKLWVGSGVLAHKGKHKLLHRNKVRHGVLFATALHGSVQPATRSGVCAT